MIRIGRSAVPEIAPLVYAVLPLRDARLAHEMIDPREVIARILREPGG